MWTYRVRSGRLLNASGSLVQTGYSGHGEGKNNPEFEGVPFVGPIPRGVYDIGAPFDSDKHGPYCLRLTPELGTDEFGRDGFLMHGDSKEHPGEASEGCIIMPRAVRQEIHTGGVKRLEVTE